MERMEMVEKLRQKATVSYEEAKQALEQANWDLLDALVLLETQGKVKTGAEAYSTYQQPQGEQNAAKPGEEHGAFSRGMKKLARMLDRIIAWGTRNTFEVSKGGKRLLGMPVILFLALLFFCFWFMIPAIMLLILFGYRVGFVGPDTSNTSVNSCIDKMAQKVVEVKDELLKEEAE